LSVCVFRNSHCSYCCLQRRRKERGIREEKVEVKVKVKDEEEDMDMDMDVVVVVNNEEIFESPFCDIDFK